MSTVKNSRERPNINVMTRSLVSKESYNLLVSGYIKLFDEITPNDVILMICKYVLTKKECVVKICSLGTNFVGKSSIIERYVKNTFTSPSISSIGASFLIKYQEINECIRLKYQIWDNTGQEKFRSISPIYYRNMQAGFLAYDITNRDSFNRLEYWLHEIRSNSKDAIIVVVGNKIDLKNQRQVTTKEGEQFAKNNQCLFIETSAKLGDNIDILFEIMGKQIVERFNLDYIDANQCNYTLLEKKMTAKPTSSYYDACVVL